MEDEDGPFLAKEMLKRIGVDITAWNEDWKKIQKVQRIRKFFRVKSEEFLFLAILPIISYRK